MRLIDADALLPMMKYATTDNEIGVFPIKIGFNTIAKVIDDAPTIDAVTVADIIEVEKERNYWHDLADSYERTILKLNNALQESVPVRHGKWIDRNGAIVAPFWERYECSECGARSDNSNYCPNCGALMDGEVEGRKKK